MTIFSISVLYKICLCFFYCHLLIILIRFIKFNKINEQIMCIFIYMYIRIIQISVELNNWISLVKIFTGVLYNVNI